MRPLRELSSTSILPRSCDTCGCRSCLSGQAREFSVSDIAKAAAIADGTIYLYFDGKEDLLVNIFREHTRSYLQSLEHDLTHARKAEERMRTAIRHHLQTLGRDRSLAIVAQVEL